VGREEKTPHRKTVWVRRARSRQREKNKRRRKEGEIKWPKVVDVIGGGRKSNPENPP